MRVSGGIDLKIKDILSRKGGLILLPAMNDARMFASRGILYVCRIPE